MIQAVIAEGFMTEEDKTELSDRGDVVEVLRDGQARRTDVIRKHDRIVRADPDIFFLRDLIEEQLEQG